MGTNSSLIGFDKKALEYELSASGALEIVRNTMGEARFTTAALQLANSPQLIDCDPPTIIGGMLKAAVFNLDLTPELGYCWLIGRNAPIKDSKGKNVLDKNGKTQYKRQAAFQMGAYGWQQFVYRGNGAESFRYGTVYSNDEFEYRLGTGAFIRHIENQDPRNRGKKTWFYTIATLPSGREVFELMNAFDAEMVRMRSEWQTENGVLKALDNKSNWGKYYSQMVWRSQMASMCKRSLKRTPLIEDGLRADNSVTIFKDGQEIVTTPSQVYEDEAQAIRENGGAALHEDWLDMIENAKDGEALRNIYKMAMDANPAAATPLYNAVMSRAQALGLPKKQAA